MPILYVNRQGATVRKKDNQVLVMQGGAVLEEVPIHKLEQLVLMGSGVQLSTALLIALLQQGIPVSLTNQQGSYHYATLTPGVSRFGALRTQQMYQVHDPAQALALAQGMIGAKLANQRKLLTETGWAAAGPAIGQIDAALAGAQGAATIDSLRGYEGTAAAAYFAAWRVSLPATWGFDGRSFYPPKDPVNALLSFGYTMALNDVLVAVQMTGLDPYLGTFHVIEAGRPSLALDLLEEFRPLLVDRLVLELVGAGQLGRSHFERPAGKPDAMYLSAEGRALLIDRYERLLGSAVALPGVGRTPWRRCIHLQAQAVARVFRGDQERYVGVTG